MLLSRLTLPFLFENISKAERGVMKVRVRELLNSSLSVVIVASVVFASGVFADVVEAATYYVATTGSDSNSCAAAQNISTPKRSINAGLACLAAGNGDTVYIRG